MDESTAPPSDIWSFRREGDGWIWERLSINGELLARSRGVFADMDECVTDAARHGYVASTTA